MSSVRLHDDTCRTCGRSVIDRYGQTAPARCESCDADHTRIAEQRVRWLFGFFGWLESDDEADEFLAVLRDLGPSHTHDTPTDGRLLCDDCHVAVDPHARRSR